MSARKQTLARSFGRAAHTYDAQAAVQRYAAERLMDTVRSVPDPARGLEIGCGTGLLSEQLLAAWPQTDWLLSDIAPDMLARCQQRVGDRARFTQLDGEHLPTDRRYDLICSSLCFQWFEDLPQALTRLYAQLRPGGSVVFSTLGPHSFREWRQLHNNAGLEAGVIPYPSASQLTAELPRDAEITLTEEHRAQPYASARDFLRSLKALGANTPKREHAPLSAVALRRLMNQFDRQPHQHINYHLLYVWIRRP